MLCSLRPSDAGCYGRLLVADLPVSDMVTEFQAQNGVALVVPASVS